MHMNTKYCCVEVKMSVTLKAVEFLFKNIQGVI